MISSARGRFSRDEQEAHAPTRASNERKGGLLRRCLWPAVGLSLAVCASAGVQAQQLPGQPMPGQTMPSPMQTSGRSLQSPTMSMPGPMGASRIFQERRIKALNAERQKEMVSDTNKLMKLIAQLTAQIGKKGSDSLTPDQLHMLAKIEKLAKSVKDKMSNPVQQSVFGDSFPSPISPGGLP